MELGQPANVRAPDHLLPGRFLEPDYTNRRVSIHRYRVSVYEKGTWSFEKFSVLDLAVAVGGAFRGGGASAGHPPYFQRVEPLPERPAITQDVVFDLAAVAAVGSDRRRGGVPAQESAG